MGDRHNANDNKRTATKYISTDSVLRKHQSEPKDKQTEKDVDAAQWTYQMKKKKKKDTELSDQDRRPF